MTKKSIEFYREAYGRFKKINSGQSCGELGRLLGVDSTTISAWRRGRTPEGAGFTPIPQDILDQARLMLERGYTYRMVAEYYDISHDTLSKHFPGMGWKRGKIPTLEYDLDSYV